MPLPIPFAELRDYLDEKPDDAMLLKRAKLRLKSGKVGIVVGVEPRATVVGGPLITISTEGKFTRVGGFTFVEALEFDAAVYQHLQLQQAIHAHVTEVRARNEHRKLVRAAEQARRMKAEEKHRFEQELHVRELERLRQIDRKYDIIQNEGLSPAREIAGRLEQGHLPNNKEIERMKIVGQIGLVGHILFARFDARGDYWDAVWANRAWRDAEISQRGIEKLVPIANANHQWSGEFAALLTTLGGSFRDVGELGRAEDYANQALGIGIRIHNERYYPHNLLGALCLQTDRIAEGEAHFSRAIELGAPSRSVEAEFRSAFETDDDQLNAAAKYFLEQDAKKYEWAAQYASDHPLDNVPF